MSETFQTGDTVELTHYAPLCGTLGRCEINTPKQGHPVKLWEVFFQSGRTWWVAEYLLRRIEVDP